MGKEIPTLPHATYNRNDGRLNLNHLYALRRTLTETPYIACENSLFPNTPLQTATSGGRAQKNSGNIARRRNLAPGEQKSFLYPTYRSILIVDMLCNSTYPQCALIAGDNIKYHADAEIWERAILRQTRHKYNTRRIITA